MVEDSRMPKRTYQYAKTVDAGRVEQCWTKDLNYRYYLTIPFSDRPSGKEMLILMMNPSYTDATKCDRTVRTIQEAVYNSPELTDIAVVTILNLYAYRHRDSAQLSELLASEDHELAIGPENDRWIAAIAERAAMVVFAWGKPSRLKGVARERYAQRISEVNTLIGKRLDEVLCADKSQGYPLHGLRWPWRGVRLVPYRDVQ